MAKKYKEIDPNLNLVALEKAILEFWDKKKIFEKVNEKGKDKPQWVYYDGPITANGMPHYGHAITWTMKDILPRYYTMRDYFVSRNLGWDCQGILVEYEIEKQLGFKHKSEIEQMGVDKFNQMCRESVLKYRKVMTEYERRIGRWIDHNDEYATMDPTYIESIWWSLKELYNKGLLYEGYKVVAYSTRAGMTLSAHEVADGGYKDVEDPAVTVKFALKDLKDTYLLAWTTTPWTLPGNLLLAIGKKVEYVKVKANDEFYILAKDRVEGVLGEEAEVVEDVDSKDLVGKEYTPLFDYYSDKSKEGAFKVVYGDHVNTEEGTGIVHLAPYGVEDFDILIEQGITLFDYISETGEFTDEIPEYAGLFYKKANEKIIGDLENKGTLFKHEKYTHSVPIDYRTKTPLIYKPIKSWYVAVNKIKKDLVSEAKKVGFVPELGGQRFLNWIENAKDWSLSRRRFWGTPMPVWVNDQTGEALFVGSFEELESLSGRKLGEDFDPHKPFVDEITWKDANGGTYRRVPEVVDVWYDSGSMPFAQYHYPFENEDKFKKRFPAEYISEGDDQIRLWFYTMFVLGIALFGKSPFKNVVVIGMLGDEEGKKMSKSKGNYPPVEEVFENYGSDMFRYFLLTSPVVRGEASRFSYKLLEETKKELFTMLWNSYRYFMTYADLFGFDKSEEFTPEHVLDKWILSRLAQTNKSIRENLEKYEIMYAAREIAPFVNDLSTWYIRRSRDRISEGDLGSLNTLYICLYELSKLLAPFMPFLCEEIYQGVTRGGGLESVHLSNIEDAEELSNDAKSLLEQMESARKIASIGNAIRKEKSLPVRQPLQSMVVVGVNALDDEVTEILKDELNVKSVTYAKEGNTGWFSKEENGIVVYLDPEITEELELEGAARELMREIQKLRKEADVAWDKEVSVQYKSSELFDKAVEKLGEDIKKKTLVSDLSGGNEFKILKLSEATI